MEIPKIYKSLFPKCILSKYLLKIYVQIKITNVIFLSKHVQRAAANFDLYQINPVKVSRRDGINYVFNGQHTIEIVALVSGSRETPVWCMVYDDLVYTQEADIFANQMKYVKSLLPYEIFMLILKLVMIENLLFVTLLNHMISLLLLPLAPEVYVLYPL